MPSFRIERYHIQRIGIDIRENQGRMGSEHEMAASITAKGVGQKFYVARVCRQLIPMMAETNCTAARKVDFSLSYRVAIPLNCLSLAKKRSMMFRFL